MLLDQCRILELPKIANSRGNLTFVEGGKHVPFDIRRVYYLYDVPGGAARGGHGHKALSQLIIAVSGSFDVLLDDGSARKKVHLNRSYYGLYICPLIWREIDNFSSGAVCMVIASDVYDEDDYYRDYSEFLDGVRGAIMKIPFLDLGAAYRELKEEIDAAIARVLESGWYILGPEVESFEAEFASYCEAKYAVGVANGLDALILALRALGIRPGDEVLVPSNTYIATWLAVSEVGATPVPIEPDPSTHNIDPGRLAASITPRSRAVIAVHLYGQPADLDGVGAIARAHGLAVVEDAAQAQGARYNKRRIGSHGDIVCWSFYPAKNLGALGDGGAVTTNDTVLADRLRVLGNYGSRKKYHNEIRGLNSRLDPLQAAVLRVKLRHLDEWNDRRRRIAARYLEGLQGANVILPIVPSWADPIWHLFVVRSEQRARLQEGIAQAGIATQIHYPIAPFQQPAYMNSGLRFSPLPIASRLAEEVLSLPIGPHQSLTDTDRIIEVVTTVAGGCPPD